jgi:hypothetical protein
MAIDLGPAMPAPIAGRVAAAGQLTPNEMLAVQSLVETKNVTEIPHALNAVIVERLVGTVNAKKLVTATKASFVVNAIVRGTEGIVNVGAITERRRIVGAIARIETLLVGHP